MENFLNQWKKGLERTRKTTFGRIATIFGATEINNTTWDELEAMLIQADLGIETTESIITSMQGYVKQAGITATNELLEYLRDELYNRLDPLPAETMDWPSPAVILLVGVNGSGKTTTAAKLASIFLAKDKKVLFAGADTFRAAAIDQLKVWGERLDIPVIAGQPNSDPGSVAFDAVQAAVARKSDIVLVDTAGRLHTRYNLMEELKKIYRVVGKALPGAPFAVWLVLDATTGQNALFQARSFKEAVHVNGIILAKLDSSSRGGMAFAIQKELGIPILYAGLGENSDDLQEFNRQAYVDGILAQ
jgi:fused signal recognition particle receptor